jgi:hypothetical protein
VADEMIVYLEGTGTLRSCLNKPMRVEKVTKTQVTLSYVRHPAATPRRFMRSTGKEIGYADEIWSYWQIRAEDLQALRDRYPPEG